jgi:site-specific DNA-methyltransferase (adenine-specific)
MNKHLSEVTNEDCMEGMARYPDKYFDLAIVDPPYGIGDVFIPVSTGVKPCKIERTHKVMDWDNEIPTPQYFIELKRVSKKQIIWGANYFNCFNNGGALIWYKNNGAPTLSQCEIASLSFKKSVDYVFIQVLGGFVQKDKPIHPTQKPVALYKWLLQNYAKQGDKILDTHLGSGSSRIAAYEMGFDFTAFELDKEYFEAQEKRYKAHIAQLKMELV